MTSKEFKLAILASGNGSTSELMFQAPELVSLVISNNIIAGILDRAKSHGIPTLAITRQDYQQFGADDQIDRVASNHCFQNAILSALQRFEITHLAQQGWMVMTGQAIIDSFQGRITNSHPGPLDPGFLDLGGVGMYGPAVHKAAITLRHELGPMFVSGPTIHLVDRQYDHGAILSYTKVAVLPTDTVESLTSRIKHIEAEQSLHFWQKVQRTGQIIPISRAKRLFLPSQYDLVEQAKESAIATYSH